MMQSLVNRTKNSEIQTINNTLIFKFGLRSLFLKILLFTFTASLSSHAIAFVANMRPVDLIRNLANMKTDCNSEEMLFSSIKKFWKELSYDDKEFVKKIISDTNKKNICTKYSAEIILFLMDNATDCDSQKMVVDNIIINWDHLDISQKNEITYSFDYFVSDKTFICSSKYYGQLVTTLASVINDCNSGRMVTDLSIKFWEGMAEVDKKSVRLAFEKLNKKVDCTNKHQKGTGIGTNFSQ